MYKHLIEIGRRVLGEHDPDRLLAVAMDGLIEMTGAERGLIILFDGSGRIRFQTARNLNREALGEPKYEVSRSIIEKARTTGTPLYLRNARQDPRFQSSHSVSKLKILSVICLPLFHGAEVFGEVYLDNRRVRGAFEPEHFEFAKTFAEFISIAAYQALERRQLLSTVEALHKSLREDFRFDRIIGAHPEIMKILALIAQVADTDATVLVQGESGTGKELIAYALHENSRRAEKPFVAINCGAMPDELLESELFGHVKGAFTGAATDRIGWFERAFGGTIFLDEVAEMSPAMQVKLLRILQTGEFSPLGSSSVRQADVRVVAASNKNLPLLVEQGTFREDLYYRLNVIAMRVPALRDRRSDIPLLAAHFVTIYGQKYRKPLSLSGDALAVLMNYDYPGNIRELENLVQRAVILARGDRIEAAHLPAELLSPQVGAGAAPLHFREAKQRAIEQFERQYLIARLAAAGGNISQAARDAGVNVKNFFTKLQKYGIEAKDFKP